MTEVEITDPTAAGEGFEVAAQDIVQLEKRPLAARRVVVRLGRCHLVEQSTNLRVRVRSVVNDQLMAFAVYGLGARGTINGLAVGPERVVVARGNAQVELVVEAGYESITVLAPPALLSGPVTGRGPAWLPQEESVVALQAGGVHARSLFDWGTRLANLAARRPAAFSRRARTLAAAQSKLLALLQGALDAARALDRTRADRTRQDHGRIVRIAEDYALARVRDGLYSRDLCAAAGVSERTLENAFHEVLGLSPLAYLARLRLHRVRQALRTAARGSTTVSAEALNWGFGHFGEFARAYRECFGELPSETLRRRPAGVATIPARPEGQDAPGET